MVDDGEAVVSVAIVAGKVSGVEELEELLTFDRLSLERHHGGRGFTIVAQRFGEKGTA